MNKKLIVYGAIAGAITGLMMFITMPLYKSGTLNLDYGMIIGFATMFIALSLVFFGVKNVRDNHLEGRISFLRAFGYGIVIAFTASLVYCVSWEICYHTITIGFEETYSEMILDNLKKEGVSDDLYQKTVIEMEEFKQMYKKPVLRFGMTLMEIFPIGIIFSLISAFILKKK